MLRVQQVVVLLWLASCQCGTNSLRPVSTCAESCGGCCDLDGRCHLDESSACGMEGETCVPCFLGQVCQAGQCRFGVQARVDAGPDASDAGPDGGFDAGPQRDAGTDAGNADAGSSFDSGAGDAGTASPDSGVGPTRDGGLDIELEVNLTDGFILSHRVSDDGGTLFLFEYRDVRCGGVQCNTREVTAFSKISIATGLRTQLYDGFMAASHPFAVLQSDISSDGTLVSILSEGPTNSTSRRWTLRPTTLAASAQAMQATNEVEPGGSNVHHSALGSGLLVVRYNGVQSVDSTFESVPNSGGLALRPSYMGPYRGPHGGGAISPRDEYCVFQHAPVAMFAFDCRTGHEVGRYPAPGAPEFRAGLQFSDDRILTGAEDEELKAYEVGPNGFTVLNTVPIPPTLLARGDVFRAAAFSPTRQRVVFMTRDIEWGVLEVPTGRALVPHQRFQVTDVFPVRTKIEFVGEERVLIRSKKRLVVYRLP